MVGKQLSSKGLISELLVAGEETIIEKYADFICAKTPKNPEFFWGNYVIFFAPPETKNCNEWAAMFDSVFLTIKEVAHTAMT